MVIKFLEMLCRMLRPCQKSSAEVVEISFPFIVVIREEATNASVSERGNALPEILDAIDVFRSAVRVLHGKSSRVARNGESGKLAAEAAITVLYILFTLNCTPDLMSYPLGIWS